MVGQIMMPIWMGTIPTLMVVERSTVTMQIPLLIQMLKKPFTMKSDDNCDPSDDYDADGDGFPAAGFGFGFIGAVDCDDINAAVNPDATETFYDGIDSDCDEGSDFDSDGDGYDAIAYGGDDCDDEDDAFYPGAYESTMMVWMPIVMVCLIMMQMEMGLILLCIRRTVKIVMIQTPPSATGRNSERWDRPRL